MNSDPDSAQPGLPDQKPADSAAVRLSEICRQFLAASDQGLFWQQIQELRQELPPELGQESRQKLRSEQNGAAPAPASATDPDVAGSCQPADNGDGPKPAEAMAPPMQREPPPSPETLWKVAATSQRGTRHIRSGAPCQDSHRVRRVGKELLVIAVADGMGSAARSEEGSSCATEAVVHYLCDRVREFPAADDTIAWTRLCMVVMDYARQKVLRRANDLKVDAKDLNTTLLMLVATPRFVWAAQVGDGAIVVADKNGGYHTLTRPDNGEYVNQTYSLVSSLSLTQVQVTPWHGDIAGVAAFTDGIQMQVLTGKNEPHADFFQPSFAFLGKAERKEEEARQEIERFLQSPDVTDRSDDDITLVLASWQGG